MFDLPFGNVTDQFDKDPTQIWIAARTLAAVLGMPGVLAVWWAARRLWGAREGLVAAAVLSFAFLPVAYSRVAVTDVGALVGVALALWLAVRAYERGRLRDYALAGAAAGLAIAFKYTAGLVLLPLGHRGAARLRARPARARSPGSRSARRWPGVVFAGARTRTCSARSTSWWHDLRGQAEVAADQPKPGQESGGLSYYLDSLTWGLGWAGCAAAVGGRGVELRRNVVRGLLLLALPLALLVYLSLQSRYFGRWLLPAYPALALLAGVAIVRVADALAERMAGAAALVGWPASLAAASTALVLAQPFAADVRTALVLGREDTREQARDFLVDELPAGAARLDRAGGAGTLVPHQPERPRPRLAAALRAARRLDRARAGLTPARRHAGLRALPARPVHAARRRRARLRVPAGPAPRGDRRLPLLRLLPGRHLRHRARARRTERRARSPRLLRPARARVDAAAPLLAPTTPAPSPVPFDFDLSFNYEPTAYERPGPVVTIYRLTTASRRYGTSLIQIPSARGAAAVRAARQGGRRESEL